MSEDSTPQPTEPQAGDGSAFDYTAPDWALQDLQDLANYPGIGAPVTLTTGGLAIFGILASGRRFFDAQAKAVRASSVEVHRSPEATEPFDTAPVLEAMAKNLERLGTVYDVDDEEERKAKPLPVYVHLENASMVTPGGRVEIGWWRGRLSSISGWTVSAGTD